LRADVGPAAEGDQGAGHDEHQHGTDQQRTGGSETRQIGAQRTQPPDQSIDCPTRDVPRRSHFYRSYFPFRDLLADLSRLMHHGSS
jgi:hypothetical protein